MRKKMIALFFVAMFTLANAPEAQAATIVQYSFYVPFVGWYYWEYTVK